MNGWADEGATGTEIRREPVGLLRGSGFDLGPRALRYPRRERTMLRLLSDQSELNGDRVWVVFDGRDQLTFSAAQELVARVANALVATIGMGAHVALLLRNQIEFLPALYGAMAAEGLAVPLNAEARGRLLEQMLSDCEARVVICRADLLHRLEEADSLAGVSLVVAVGDGDLPESIHGVPLTSWKHWIRGRSVEPPNAQPNYDDDALIQFTSGTTGRSKGAVYPHHFLYLYSAMVADSLDHDADEVLMTPLPMYHVAALHLVANAALHAGATAHLSSRFSANAFWSDAASCGATYGVLLGPMAAIVQKVCDAAPRHQMSRMFCVPPPPDPKGFEELFGVRLLWQGYGMTEVYPLPMRPDILDAPPDTIGYPVRWMEYGVVDDSDELVAPGEVGELVFRPLIPHAMARGYYRNPEATVAAFRNCMFHTGDLASYDPDGLLHYRGRRHDRIRRRGENISSSELETLVLRHPDVLEAAAYGVDAEFGEQDIKLDVVGGARLDLPELYEWCVRELPRYMVPRYLERREALPKTPSERVEKYKLSEMGVDRPAVLDTQLESGASSSSDSGASDVAPVRRDEQC